MVNLSNRELSNAEKCVLNLGLNFVLVPRKIPYVDIAAGVEGVAHKMNNEEASKLRGSVRSILKVARLLKPNLTKAERKALKDLKQDNHITILPADKGNATVVLDAEAYEQKVWNLLQDTVYEKIMKDPTQVTERKCGRT